VQTGNSFGRTGNGFQAYAREIAWREDNRRVANGTQWKWIISAALAHPKSSTWAGYWHREKRGWPNR
jgi:hypothetical protein